MKVFIDKHGGIQYHKEDCRIMIGRSIHAHVEYTPLELFCIEPHGTRTIDGVIYHPCPYCFPRKLVGTIDSHFYEYGGINE